MSQQEELKLGYLALLLSMYNIDEKELVRRANRDTVKHLSEKIKIDQIVPFDTGELQDSCEIEFSDDGFAISWNTKYAIFVYYNPKGVIQQIHNKNAKKRWFDEYIEAGTVEYNYLREHYLDRLIINAEEMA